MHLDLLSIPQSGGKNVSVGHGGGRQASCGRFFCIIGLKTLKLFCKAKKGWVPIEKVQILS